jgi:dephospho-CoA kinase
VQYTVHFSLESRLNIGYPVKSESPFLDFAYDGHFIKAGEHMPFLIAVAGLSGAGKTTFINHLETLGAGTRVYLGQGVHDAIRAKGLQPTPENEKIVRFDLRSEHGPGALAAVALPKILESLVSGRSVLVDAIFAMEEYQLLKTCENNCTSTLVAIRAPFETRAIRLRSRSVRPLTEQELRERDMACTRFG